MRRAAVAIVASALVLTGCSGTPATHATSIRLPDVTLRSFTGGAPLRLGDLRGPAVVNVWASWCGPCRKELPRYQAYAAAHHDVKVLGIDFQDTSRDRARALIRQTGVRYPLYADPTGALHARVLPQLILVDAHGHVAHQEYVVISSVAQLDRLVATHLQVAS